MINVSNFSFFKTCIFFSRERKKSEKQFAIFFYESNRNHMNSIHLQNIFFSPMTCCNFFFFLILFWWKRFDAEWKMLRTNWNVQFVILFFTPFPHNYSKYAKICRKCTERFQMHFFLKLFLSLMFIFDSDVYLISYRLNI